ncbi:MAG TPA: NUDIX hydrolase [Xanthobacteraceae bacterium]|nr:NUDIX hydrolase [Xanthobacteraceae bacterium]
MKAGAELQAWRVKDTRHVFRDRWVSLRADSCVTAEGAQIDPYYILELADWVQVVAVTAQAQVVMIRQYRHGLKGISLEVPSGVVDVRDADPLAAAARELLEETGYAADSFELVGRLSPVVARLDNTISVVLARNARQVQPPAVDATEVVSLHLMSCEEAVQAALAGGMVEASQIAALLMALRHGGLIDISVKSAADRS